MKQLGMLEDPPTYPIGTNTQKFKRSKDLIQPPQSTASLIMHILDHINKDQKANFGSTRTIFEC